MLSKEEKDIRAERVKTLKGVGVGIEFGKDVIKEIMTLNQYDADADKVRREAAAAQDSLNTSYQQVSQADLTRSILSGMDYNSGTVAQVAAQRLDVLKTQQRRVDEQRSKSLSTISDNETGSILSTAASGLLGVIGWLLL